MKPAVFPLVDELVLFDENKQELVVLNETSVLLWRALGANRSLQSVVDELTAHFGETHRTDITEDLCQLEQRWRAKGWLTPDRQTTEAASAIAVNSPSAPVDVSQSASGVQTDPLFTLHLSLLDQHVVLTTDDKLAAQVSSEMFNHLTVDSNSCADAELSDNARLYVERIATGWRMHIRDGPVVESSDLGPLLHGQVLLQAYLGLKPFAAFHAAAVSKGERCILLPGVAGAGKSTLTAGLVHAGYGYCTDELAILTDPEMQLMPCPINIGIKAGSWAVVGAFDEQIHTLQVWQRDDGQKIRYLPPPTGTVQHAGDLKEVVALVFPEFFDPDQPHQEEAGTLTPMSPGIALQQLTGAGYHLNQALTSDWVAGATRWLSGVECFVMRYSSIEQSIDLIDKVLART